MLHTLTVIGEARSKLSDSLKSRHSSVRWQRVSAVRHRIVHDYSGLDFELVWPVRLHWESRLGAALVASRVCEFRAMAITPDREWGGGLTVRLALDAA